MHISPPILLPRIQGESYEAWVVRCMPIDKTRAYPVNKVGAWHGGVHIPHTDFGSQVNPIRAIADGVIIFARYPSENKNKEPLAYNGKTDDGCILIRHEILIGDEPVLFAFYSLTMHMKQVRPEIIANIGKQIKRESVLGTSGCVDGGNAVHFQICCDKKNFDILCGRTHGYVDTTKKGRDKPAYGDRYHYMPLGMPVHEGSASGIAKPAIYFTTEPLYIINKGGQIQVLKKKENSQEFESVGKKSVAVSYICEPLAVSQTAEQIYSEWVNITIPGCTGWVDVSSSHIQSYSDGDFPDWAGWTIIDDDHSADSQCNSDVIKKWQAQALKGVNTESLLTYSICQFPFEWNGSTFDTRFAWVKTKTPSHPNALTKEEYSKMKKHVEALCFFDKLPANNQKELSEQIWHFEPRIFITQIQKAERRLIFKTKRKMNDFTADDMRHGDMTKEQILAQGKLNKTTIFGREMKLNLFDFNKTIDEHFNSMGGMGYWTAWGEYSPLIEIMIEKFRKNEGGVLQHELLNKAFIEHKTTKECVVKIKGFIDNILHSNGFNAFSESDLERLNKDIANGVKLPKFDDWDWFNGLGITIHDTWSTKIYLEYVDVSGASDKKYKAGLYFHIQDHFGLDVDDLNGKGFENSPWFCSWFILQRYKSYGFKPFINEANFRVIIGS